MSRLDPKSLIALGFGPSRDYPEDPTASVRVESVDENGMTIWLADFERDEMEFLKISETGTWTFKSGSEVGGSDPLRRAIHSHLLTKEDQPFVRIADLCIP